MCTCCCHKAIPAIEREITNCEIIFLFHGGKTELRDVNIKKGGGGASSISILYA